MSLWKIMVVPIQTLMTIVDLKNYIYFIFNLYTNPVYIQQNTNASVYFLISLLQVLKFKFKSVRL